MAVLGPPGQFMGLAAVKSYVVVLLKLADRIHMLNRVLPAAIAEI
jgi:hypothetical protein